jgi:hypothetical protein
MNNSMAVERRAVAGERRWGSRGLSGSPLVQVLSTYVSRPRFLLLWPPYLFVPPVASACIGALLACFLALHARRQFGTAAARLVPGFVAPHLMGALGVSLLMWAGIPAAHAWRLGLRVDSVVAVYALTGLLWALVVIWPRAIVLVVLAPISVAWVASLGDRRPAEWLERFTTHGDPWIAVPLIAGALVAQVVACWFLLRLTDQSAVLDDLAADAPRSEGAAGKFEEWLLERRDAVVARQLALAGTGLWSIRRWRIPVATSWPQSTLYPATMAIGLAVTASLVNDKALLVFVMLMTNAVFAFVPFSNWRGRRQWMSAEVMRPVTRDQYFCEIAAALAWDVGVWYAAMAATGAVVLAAFNPPASDRTILAVGAYVAVLAGLGTLMFGWGLYSMRLRYWFARLFFGALVWSMLSVWTLSATLTAIRLLRPAPLLLPLLWALTSGLVGLRLVQIARRRWAAADLD